MITLSRKHSKIILVDNLIEPSVTSKKDGTKSMNFGSVFRPFYYLSRIWGLTPYSITENSNGDVRKPKIYIHDSLWFMISICLYSLFFESSLIKFKISKDHLKKETWILILFARLMELFTYAYGISTIILNVCNRFKLIDMIKMYVCFDREVTCAVNECVVHFV